MELIDGDCCWDFLDYSFIDDHSPADILGRQNSILQQLMELCRKKKNRSRRNARGRESPTVDRGRTGSCSRPGTKACRERLRRERLNDRFMDLSSVLEPGRPAKTDKPTILDDAIRVLNQLRTEAQELKETNKKLLEEIKSLKAEKNEMKEEKLVLKADKEKMEQKLKVMAFQSPSGFMQAHPAAFHPNKMAVFPSYGYIPMWQYLPPSARDTSHDHELRPPAA